MYEIKINTTAKSPNAIVNVSEITLMKHNISIVMAKSMRLLFRLHPCYFIDVLIFVIYY